MTLMAIKPRTGYYQGIPRRLFNKLDRFAYPYPDFAHIGEQEIYNRELYNDTNDPGNNNLVFGYIPRYSEFKYRQNEVHGEFKQHLMHGIWTENLRLVRGLMKHLSNVTRTMKGFGLLQTKTLITFMFRYIIKLTLYVLFLILVFQNCNIVIHKQIKINMKK